MRPVQYFSDAYLEHCRKATPEQVLTFLEAFRLLHQQNMPVKSKLISLKVPEPLLTSFRQRCDMQGVKYQTWIKKLMERWLDDG